MIDAAGAIYVIGGHGGTLYQDVWVSTDEGDGGLLAGYWPGTTGVLRSTRGY